MLCTSTASIACHFFRAKIISAKEQKTVVNLLNVDVYLLMKAIIHDFIYTWLHDMSIFKINKYLFEAHFLPLQIICI